jgi:glycerol-3-phosphate dehydrogenase (NAD(P)+)
MSEIVILGDGAWGTALAVVLDRAGRKVTLWSRFPRYAATIRKKRENVKFLPGVPLSPSIGIASGPAPRAGVYIAAVPTQHMRETFGELKPSLPKKAVYVCLAKGLEQNTGKRPTQILREILGRVRVVTLSGPSHAPEVAAGLPASLVVAGSPGATREAQGVLSSETLRVYTSVDLIGVELGGALKNVIALAGGVCDGLGLGHNAKAALLTRGIVEMARLGVRLGAKWETFFGLSGMGDLITTTTFPKGRNLFVGREVGRGRRLQGVLEGMSAVAEGVWTTKAVLALARRCRVEMPITEEVHALLFRGKPPAEALRALMGREPRAETDRRRVHRKK